MIRKNDAVKIIVFSFISGKIAKFLEKSRIFSIFITRERDHGGI